MLFSISVYLIELESSEKKSHFIFQFFYAIASSKSSNVIVLGLAQIMVSL